MNKWTLILLLNILTFHAQAAQIESIHDGDTFTLRGGEKIRLWGADAPEVKQPYGEEARQYLVKITTGKDVTLECVGYSFKRQVCHAQAGGLDLSREMVGRGFAFDSARYSHGAFAAAQAFAKSQHRGVWQLPDGGVRPWEFRHPAKRG